ncbi:hypothetical protein ABID59_004088 [Bradyrhizobium sp. S3.3.6]
MGNFNYVLPCVRDKLTTARTYYVRTDGNDSNTGLVNTAAGAFLTIQKAINVAATLDSNNFDVTIQIAQGQGAVTFALGTGLVAKSMIGGGSIIIVGDETTPANVVLDCGATNATGLLADATKTVYQVRGIKLTASGAGTSFGLYAFHGGYIQFQNIVIGAGWLQQIRAVDTGLLTATGNFSIAGGASGGGAGSALAAVAGIIRVQGVTITISSGLTFDNFVASNTSGAVLLGSVTWAGSSFSGARYSLVANGVLNTGGQATTWIPGNAAGTTATGGQYI